MNETLLELLGRKVKLRVWDPTNRQMRLYNMDDFLKGRVPTDADGHVVHQFTHLIDRNDADVYEGDLVKVYGAPEVYYTRVVLWRPDRAGWWIYKSNGLFDVALTTELKPKIEVIGNIIENPHELK